MKKLTRLFPLIFVGFLIAYGLESGELRIKPFTKSYYFNQQDLYILGILWLVGFVYNVWYFKKKENNVLISKLISTSIPLILGVSCTIIVLNSIVPNIENKEHIQKNYLENVLIESYSNTTNPYVIIEIKNSQKYVQFGNFENGLIFELPNIGLNVNELAIANDIFSKYKILLREEIATDPETMKDFKLEVWRRSFSRDEIKDAANFTILILNKVYGLKSVDSLSIIKGWK